MVSAFGGGFDGVWLRQMDFIGGSEWCHSALVHGRILAQRSPHSSAPRPPLSEEDFTESNCPPDSLTLGEGFVEKTRPFRRTDVFFHA